MASAKLLVAWSHPPMGTEAYPLEHRCVPGARTFAINLIMRIHGVQSKLQVCSNDTAYPLKTRIHCVPPGGEEDVSPPSVTRLLFGGIEIADNDMLEAHEIEDQAEVSLKCMGARHSCATGANANTCPLRQHATPRSLPRCA